MYTHAPAMLYCHFFISLSFPCCISLGGSASICHSLCLSLPPFPPRLSPDQCWWMASLQHFRWVRKVGKYGELRGRNRPLFQRSCPTVYLFIPVASVSAPWWLPGYSLYKHKPGQASEVICVIVGCSSLFGVNLHTHTRTVKAKVSRFVFIHNNLS